MIFPEELKIEAAEAYRQNILVPGFEHVNRNDLIDAWCCGVTYQIKKQQEEEKKKTQCGLEENKEGDKMKKLIKKILRLIEIEWIARRMARLARKAYRKGYIL